MASSGSDAKANDEFKTLSDKIVTQILYAPEWDCICQSYSEGKSIDDMKKIEAFVKEKIIPFQEQLKKIIADHPSKADDAREIYNDLNKAHNVVYKYRKAEEDKRASDEAKVKEAAASKHSEAFKELRDKLISEMSETSLKSNPNLPDSLSIAIRKLTMQIADGLLSKNPNTTTLDKLNEEAQKPSLKKAIDEAITKLQKNLAKIKEQLPKLIEKKSKIDSKMQAVSKEEFSRNKENKLIELMKEYSGLEDTVSQLRSASDFLDEAIPETDKKQLSTISSLTSSSVEISIAFTKDVMDTSAEIIRVQTEAFTKLQKSFKIDLDLETKVKEKISQQAFKLAKEHYQKIVEDKNYTVELLAELKKDFQALLSTTTASADNDINLMVGELMPNYRSRALPPPRDDSKQPPVSDVAPQPSPSTSPNVTAKRFEPAKLLANLNKVQSDKWKLDAPSSEKKAPYTVKSGALSFKLYSDKLETSDSHLDTFVAMLESYKHTYGEHLPVIQSPSRDMNAWKKACKQVGYSEEVTREILHEKTSELIAVPPTTTTPPPSTPQPPSAAPRK